MALMLVICAAPISTGAEFYVSQNGKQKGTGTKEDPFDIVTALSGRKSVQPGDIVWLRGGIYTLPADPRTEKFTIECRLKGTPEKPIIVRQMPGERATIDGALTLAGSDTWYWGIEVRGTRDTPRVEGNDCVTVVGPRTKMINLIIHRGTMESGFWSPAVDAEQYSNLFFDFGYSAEDRGHGHACYTQNETGTKRILDNIMFAGHGWNQHNYTEQGQITGYHIEGNIIFSAGMASSPDDPPKDNLLICGYQPADRYTIANNIAYHSHTGGWRYNVRLGTYMKRPETNGATMVKNNYLMGYNGLALLRWLKIEATGNEIWAPMILLHLEKGEGTQDQDWIIDRNIYHLQPDEQKPNGKTLAEHRKITGFDRNSKLVSTTDGRPTGTRVFVRANRYESGRAHVAVFNWDGNASIEVDLKNSGLKRGQKFQIRNVLNLYNQPIVESTYNEKPIAIPMMKSAIAPDFDAFLVIPEESFTSFVAHADEPQMDWTKLDWKNGSAGAGKGLHWMKEKKKN